MQDYSKSPIQHPEQARVKVAVYAQRLSADEMSNGQRQDYFLWFAAVVLSVLTLLNLGFTPFA